MKEQSIVYVFPNQKVIHTKKALTDQEHIYSKLNCDATKIAANALSNSGFKLYVWMMLNQDGYDYALSGATVKKETGLSLDSYRRAVQELIRTGYLVCNGTAANSYTIYEERPCIPPQNKQRTGKMPQRNLANNAGALPQSTVANQAEMPREIEQDIEYRTEDIGLSATSQSKEEMGDDETDLWDEYEELERQIDEVNRMFNGTHNEQVKEYYAAKLDGLLKKLEKFPIHKMVSEVLEPDQGDTPF